MQLKITTDYAIRMILYLAQNESVIVSATEIAQAMKIPHSYLIQIGAVLKNPGLYKHILDGLEDIHLQSHQTALHCMTSSL